MPSSLAAVVLLLTMADPLAAADPPSHTMFIQLSSGTPLPPPLLDWAKLKLQITRTEVVKEVRGKGIGITANPGSKLVVVTLKGNSPVSCYVAESREFAAVYESPELGPRAPDRMIQKISPAVALAFPGCEWTVFDPTAQTTSYHYFYTPGSITFQIAVTVPEHVTAFSIRYPTVAEGRAIVPARDPKSPPPAAGSKKDES